MSSAKPTLDDLRIERRPEAPRSSNKSGLIVGVLVLAALGTAAFWWMGQTKVIEVETALARKSGGSTAADRSVLHGSGYVTARREATVSAKVTGKVLEVLIEEGMKVKEGQVLARLDDSNIKTALDIAQAQLESTRLMARRNARPT
jgi:HlyD family secretion protein